MQTDKHARRMRSTGSWTVAIGLLLLASFVGATAIAPSDQVHADDELAPVAHAGTDRTVSIGERVRLDASGSLSPQGRELDYTWSLTAPRDSAATLSDVNAVRPEFSVDMLGDYIVRLTVRDGGQVSAKSSVRISTSNVAPVAVLRPPGRITVGQPLVLDASDSYDPNGDALRFHWSLAPAPDPSKASLFGETFARSTLSVSEPGDYRLQLVVSDSQHSSEPAHIEISSDNASPVAAAGADRRVVVGAAVVLDGRGSDDADGNDLAFRWSLIHRPQGSRVALSGADLMRAFLRPDRPGTYVVQLTTSDGLSRPSHDTVVLEALDMPPSTDDSRLANGVSDTDGDGVADDLDNCVETPNPAQIDTDGDGFGNFCDADLSNDGLVVDFVDLGLFRLAFFSSPGAPNWNPAADFNGDNVVDFLDLGIMRASFFGPPGPIAIRFVNPNGGSWHDPANWQPAVLPAAVHSVRIDLDPTAVVEFSSGAGAIAGIRTSSPLTLSGGELGIRGVAQFNDTLTITGGVLAEADILAPISTVPIVVDAASATLRGVQLGGDLELIDGANLIVEQGLTLDEASIRLLADTTGTALRFRGDGGAQSLLGGTGEVVFDGATVTDFGNSVLADSPGHTLVVGPDVTVRAGVAGGRVANSFTSAPLVLQGLVESGLHGRTVQITGRPLTVTGRVEASDGGRVRANMGVPTFTSPGGAISAGASIVGVDAQIDLHGSFLNSGTIDLTNAVLDIGNVPGHQWRNEGTIVLDASTVELGGSFASDDIGSISGTGTLVLDGALDNSGELLDLGATLVGVVELRGGGSITGGSLVNTPVVLPAAEAFTFDTVALSADLTIGESATMTITGGLALQNATVVMDGIDDDYARLLFDGPAIGISTLSGTGEVLFAGATTSSAYLASNRIETSVPGHSLVIEPGIALRTVATGASLRVADGVLAMQGSITSSVPGRTVFLIAEKVVVEGGLDVSNSAGIVAAATGLGSSVTASSTVVVDGGLLSLSGSFLVDADVSVIGGVYSLGNAGSAWQQNGAVTMVGGTLRLRGSFSRDDINTITGTGDIVIAGVLDNAGQTLDLASDFSLPASLGNLAHIVGGRLGGGAVDIAEDITVSLEDIVVEAQVNVANGSTLRAVNTLSLDQTSIALYGESALTSLEISCFDALPGVIEGSGEILFAGSGPTYDQNEVRFSCGGTQDAEIGPDIVIRAVARGGVIRADSGVVALDLKGTIDASGFYSNVLLMAPNLLMNGKLLASNNGRFEVNFAGVPGDNGGTFSAASLVEARDEGRVMLTGPGVFGGSMVANGGALRLGGAGSDPWVNTGSIALLGGVLELGSLFTPQSIGVVSGNGTLQVVGTLDGGGQTVDLGALLTGPVEFARNSIARDVVLDGATPLTIVDDARFENVTLKADVDVSAGAVLTLEEALVLDGATISLLGNNTLRAQAWVRGPQSSTFVMGGNGTFRFAGTASLPGKNTLAVLNGGPKLEVGEDVTIESASAGGDIVHYSSTGAIAFEGALRSLVPLRRIRMTASDLVINGSVTIAAGCQVELSNYQLTSNTQINIEIGGTSVASTGLLTGEEAGLEGTVNLAYVNGYVPALGDAFVLLTYDAHGGTFDVTNSPPLGGGLSLRSTTGPTSVTYDVIN